MTPTTKRLLESKLWILRRELIDKQNSLQCAIKYRGNCEFVLKKAQNSEVEIANRTQTVSDEFDALFADYKALGGKEIFYGTKL